MAAPALVMPLFVNPADVILRLQLSEELQGINDVVESGIIGAQLHVERILGSKLQRQSHSCRYHLDADAYSGIQPGGVFRLELPSGFMRTDTNVGVKCSGSSGNVFGPWENAKTSCYSVDYKRGYVLMDSGTYRNQFSYITCDTGFEDGTNPIPLTDVDEYDEEAEYGVGDFVQLNAIPYRCTVPCSGVSPLNVTRWVKATIPMEPIPNEVYEAIMSMVPVIFDASQTTNRNEESVNQYKKAADHAVLVLQPYMRTKGLSFRPIV